MGGTPFLALNIAALPPQIPLEISSEILRGGASMAKKAGIVIAGGHTIQDKEPKYGLVVIGFINPNKKLTKGGSKPGDILLLSKPIGIGLVTTAIKNEKCKPEYERNVIKWMKKFNKAAADLALKYHSTAATDITGFSLLGHAWEMASASHTGMRIDFDKIPFLEGAREYASQWIFPGGCYDNEAYFKPNVIFDEVIPDEDKYLLFDPETSGGLLMAVPRDNIDDMMKDAEVLNQPLWIIGEVTEGDKIHVVKD